MPTPVRRLLTRLMLVLTLAAIAPEVHAATYDVGPGQPFETPSAVPWESLQPGDVVRIHWRATPYRDKWVIARAGTATAPIVVQGVPNAAGERPIIDGNGATTRLALDAWGESRAVIKIGGASIPTDTMPKYIVIENLDVRSARSPYTFVDDAGATQSYSTNAAAIWIEKGEHITLRSNLLHDSGNGLFVSSAEPFVSRDVHINGNAIFDNGNVGSLYEHNAYSEALGITYDYNYFGPTKAGAGGNNLKDRSAGLIVRYNWIEGGNRQLDLVETDSATIQADPSYRMTFVYGNVLLETEGSGNRQITHYGGDNGTTAKYRKGTLHFYNNTMVSYRTDRTTLFRLSTNDETADARNNVFYVVAAGTTLSLVDATGTLNLTHNWFKPGRVATFGTLGGTINDAGTSVVGSSPGFRDEAGQDFRLATGSANANAGTLLPAVSLPEPTVMREYVRHQSSQPRSNDGVLDIGAFELEDGQPLDLTIATTSVPSGTAGLSYETTLAASGGVPPYTWFVVNGGLPSGLNLEQSSGRLLGTPTQTDTWTFTLRVNDAQVPPDGAERAFFLTVAAAPVDPLIITTTSLPSARRNKSYRQTLAASGGAEPYVWRLASGSLPPGLSLGTTGLLSGVPTARGTWSFAVEVTDSQSPAVSVRQSLSVTVR